MRELTPRTIQWISQPHLVLIRSSNAPDFEAGLRARRRRRLLQHGDCCCRQLRDCSLRRRAVPVDRQRRGSASPTVIALGRGIAPAEPTAARASSRHSHPIYLPVPSAEPISAATVFVRFSYGGIWAISQVTTIPLKPLILAERGIRTLEGLLTLTPLAGVRLRPLGHLSVVGYKDRLINGL